MVKEKSSKEISISFYYFCLDEFQDQATVLNKNLSTVAIVAASDDVPLDSFTCELVHSLLAIGKHLFEILIFEKRIHFKVQHFI